MSTAASPIGLQIKIESPNESWPRTTLDEVPEMLYEHGEPLDNSLEMESQTKKEFKSFTSQQRMSPHPDPLGPAPTHMQ